MVALGVPAIHQRSRYLAKAGFPALGRSAPQLARCALCTVLKAGRHMWERAYVSRIGIQDDFREREILDRNPFMLCC